MNSTPKRKIVFSPLHLRFAYITNYRGYIQEELNELEHHVCVNSDDVRIDPTCQVSPRAYNTITTFRAALIIALCFIGSGEIVPFV